MNQISIIFPNQLFRDSPILKLNCEILMIEDSLFFGNDKFHKLINHKNKLIFHKASMLAYKKYLENLGYKVFYIDNKNNFSTVDYLSNYLEKKYQKINIYNPHDFLIMKRINSFVKANKLKLQIFQSPMFITKEDLRESFRVNPKKPLMGRFYENQRKSQNILVNLDGSPKGGKWSFDELNRKKLPKKITIPEIPRLPKNEFVMQAENLITDLNIEFIGESNHFIYPTSFSEADNWLHDFFESRIFLFGDYEDAISKKKVFLWHSLLSPLLNSGLLTPKEVINKALTFAEKNKVPMNSLEGFIRQIVGWREFICLVYEKHGTKMRTTNFWNFENNPMPDVFYTGNTGIEPVDIVINNIIKYGYCHHIERLMIVGNFMLLCRIHPDQVYKWFMEMFIDSYDWVMVPNVYGMSQFSDGGIFSTKPYISSSNYVKKMSDYKSGSWCSIWDGLFWKFIKDNETYFRKQYRLAMLTRNLDKMSDEKLNGHLTTAEVFIKNLY
ncbi:Uncharacterized deoxyribodipyrimidine photolyase-like protein [Prochlorococcus marinus str. MIT 9515]|uniref:Uncharacterized deoxyribodipyrimidine photolyase-like protein n=1 Tax=Prochlorococcus marinus (strain MIT 9515) TaxID=167542 RepID=A2BV85_PROM5|nr:cryptochrome/photolyase family protein [Prochlorococcus marinus]ABM71696.1 Uncharacterized deoxyribodipyrimidine photolyase-like protein [Prochlorococcus marinus str. MIT 9515]